MRITRVHFFDNYYVFIATFALRKTSKLSKHKYYNIMKAFVNDIEVRTYYGAKVKSVVLAYCRANNLPLKLEGIEVKDAYGNIIGLDGSLRANSKIYVKF